MICVFVNAFSNSNENRIEPIKKFLDANNIETIYLGSNFDHLRKTFVDDSISDVIQLKTLEYRKNLSLKRLISHFIYSRKVYKKLLELKPDMTYVKFPPNSLVYYASKYKKKYPDSILVFDVFDLWPESLPISSKVKKITFLFLKLWQNFRNNSLKYADIVFTECEYFSRKLNSFTKNQVHTLYLTQEDTINPNLSVRNLDEIVVCYTGSINNIIDIDFIGRIINELSKKKKVKVNIIGGGEGVSKLQDICKQNGADFENHGFIYDENIKAKIYSDSHFGINIFKSNVLVGLTMKSIDYFKFGLPLINNIRYDTEKIINEHESGFNISYDNIGEIANKIISLSAEDVQILKQNARNVYNKYFTPKEMNKKLNEFFYNILNSDNTVS